MSLWWAAGLWAEGRYGINVLRVTETVPTVASTSAASEVLRGLGYWYFYGWDKVQPWTLPSVEYTQTLWLLVLSLAVPGLSVALGLLTRWRYRSFALALIGVGTVIAVGAFPYAHPSFFGVVIKDASAGSTVALAMRSVDRIVPLVVLGLALLMGSGVTALRLRWPAAGLLAAVACVALVAADLPPLWTGAMIASNLARPSSLPAYWTAAAGHLNSEGSSSRVLGLPGEDFAAYAWGVTEDPVAPGLLDRPYVSRQVVPSGTPAAANLLQALDQPIQEGTLDMAALAPVARLMSVGQVLLQSDLQYERYHLPLPQALWGKMVPPPPGLSDPTTFGGPNLAPSIRYPLDSEMRLGLPTGAPAPPALAVFNVSDPRPLVRAESPEQPIILAGDGSGIVEAAGAGLLDGTSPVIYSASLPSGSPVMSQAMSDNAQLILTDTNPLATYRWGSLRDNVGQVQQPGVTDLASNPSDYSLPLFPGAGTGTETVADVGGVASVTASAYGDPLTFTPEDRPINAVDGNFATNWTFGAHSPVSGGRIEINLLAPVTTDHITLTQARLARPNRRITAVTILFDGKDPVRVPLTPTSFDAPGQTVSFTARTFSQLQVVVDSATGGAEKRYDGLSQVGFAEIGIPGAPNASETLRMPTDLLNKAGAASLEHQLDILMQRSRAVEPPRSDPELTLDRTFSLPTARSFSVGGTAEINAGDSDNLINQMVGLTPAGPLPAPAPSGSPGPARVIAANSSTRLDEDRGARANAALDGNPATAWIAETGPQSGEWLSFQLSKPVTFGHLDLQVVNDGRHSLPTRITLSAGGVSRTVDVPAPAVGNGRPQGSTSTIPLTFPPLTGNAVKVTIDSVEQVRALDYYSTFAGITDILPVGVAELGIAGIDEPPVPSTLPAGCMTGLLSIDGKPVDVQVTGTTSNALEGDQVSIRPCGNSIGGLRLAAGPHTVETSPRLPSGWSIDQLWLESAAGGGPAAAGDVLSSSGPAAPPASSDPAAPAASASSPPSAAAAPPAVRIDHEGRTSWKVTVTGDGQPFWLVLGQSFSSGWSAVLANGKHLGAPQLIDGYANGWYVPAGAVNGPMVIDLTWTPQEVVWAAIGVSAAAVLFALLVAVWPERWIGRRRRRPRRAGSGPPGGSSPSPASWRVFIGADLVRPRRPPSVIAVSVAAFGWAVVSASVSRPLIGVVGGVAVAVGALWARGRLAVRVAMAAALIALPVYDSVEQWVYRYWPTINWPGDVSSANDVAWLALTLLGADLIAGAVRSRRPRRVYARRTEEHPT